MSHPSEDLLYEGFSVDLSFEGEGPAFGDLFAICGYENPNFPPPGKLDFASFEDLQFSQVDDFFGVRNTSGEGDDVAVWLYPLVDGLAAPHHPGPFTGIRLQYNILRNPASRFSHFLLVLDRLQSQLPVTASYSSQSGEALDPTALQGRLRSDFESVQDYWRLQGVVLGSDSALMIDF